MILFRDEERNGKFEFDGKLVDMDETVSLSHLEIPKIVVLKRYKTIT